jgi:hypothetical protein
MKVSLSGGGGLAGAHKLTRGGDLTVHVARDSTDFEIETQPQRPRFVWFDSKLPASPIKFEIAAEGEAVPEIVHIGAAGTAPLGKPIVLETGQASGLPQGLAAMRQSCGPGVFIWWLPGEVARAARPASKLTEEEKKRLKALGYIQ